MSRNHPVIAILVAAIAMLNLDDYVVDVLMRDLVGHDRKTCELPRLFVAHLRTGTQAGSCSGELSGNGRVHWIVEKFSPKLQ